MVLHTFEELSCLPACVPTRLPAPAWTWRFEHLHMYRAFYPRLYRNVIVVKREVFVLFLLVYCTWYSTRMSPFIFTRTRTSASREKA